MAVPSVIDETFQILLRYVATGQAPHYTDVARSLDRSVQDGRQALLDTMNTPGAASWLHPGDGHRRLGGAVLQSSVPESRFGRR